MLIRLELFARELGLRMIILGLMNTGKSTCMRVSDLLRDNILFLRITSMMEARRARGLQILNDRASY